MDSVAEFQKSIDGYVNNITFQGCSVGEGVTGKRFLQILADSIGKAGAWDRPVTVVDTNSFAVPVDAKFVEVVVTHTKEIQYHVPVIINCVGNTSDANAQAMIDKANEKLKGANIRLDVKQINKNVAVGDGNSSLNIKEIEKLETEGKKELAKVIKDKNGKWTGKGLKIYIADDCWQGTNKMNWAWKENQCVGINKNSDPADLAGIVRKYFNPEKIYDPNYTEKAKAEERKEAKDSGNTVNAKTESGKFRRDSQL